MQHSINLLKIFQTLDIIILETDQMSILNNLCECFKMDSDYYQIMV